MEPHDDVDGDEEEEREEMINRAAERIHDEQPCPDPGTNKNIH